MLEEIEVAKKNLSKFKRGLSIFENQQLKESLLNDTNAPLIKVDALKTNL